MNINHFRGKTEEEAVAAARNALGNNFVNMGIRIVKPKGFLGFLRTSEYEITAAVEEDIPAEGFEKTLSNAMKNDNPPRSVDVAANEEIDLNKLPDVTVPLNQVRPVRRVTPQQHKDETLTKEQSAEIERKLGNLQEILTQSLSAVEKKREEDIEQEKIRAKEKETASRPEEKHEETGINEEDNTGFVKVLYKTLLDNEVDEKCINQLIFDLTKVINEGSSVDFILSNIYQKMVLNLGKPDVLSSEQKKPQLIFFIGPTGVGKTTTIAKLASKMKVELGKNVAFLTADTYRIAAVEQLRTYAKIIDAPLSVIYTPADLKDALDKHVKFDYVFVDTAGFSHKNEKQKDETRQLLSIVDERFDKKAYLVLSVTTKYKDLLEICDIYKTISDYSIVFTKLDETTLYGNIYNVRQYTGVAVSYTTNGQAVPDDISVLDAQSLVKKLLGG